MLALTFDTTSVPTAVKVTSITELISSELNMVIKSVGIALPTSGTDFYNLVKLKCMQGSAGIIGMTYTGNKDSVSGVRPDWYIQEYKEFLKSLKETPELYKDTVFVSSIGNQVTDGTYTEAEVSDVMIGEWEE